MKITIWAGLDAPHSNEVGNITKQFLEDCDFQFDRYESNWNKVGVPKDQAMELAEAFFRHLLEIGADNISEIKVSITTEKVSI